MPPVWWTALFILHAASGAPIFYDDVQEIFIPGLKFGKRGDVFHDCLGSSDEEHNLDEGADESLNLYCDMRLDSSVYKIDESGADAKSSDMDLKLNIDEGDEDESGAAQLDTEHLSSGISASDDDDDDEDYSEERSRIKQRLSKRPASKSRIKQRLSRRSASKSQKYKRSNAPSGTSFSNVHETDKQPELKRCAVVTHQEESCDSEPSSGCKVNSNQRPYREKSKKLRKDIYKRFINQIKDDLDNIYSYYWKHWPVGIDRRKGYWTNEEQSLIKAVIADMEFIKPTDEEYINQDVDFVESKSTSPTEEAETIADIARIINEQSRKRKQAKTKIGPLCKSTMSNFVPVRITETLSKRVVKVLEDRFSNQTQRPSWLMRQYIWINWPGDISKYKRCWTGDELRSIVAVLGTITFKYPASQEEADVGNCEPSNLDMYTWTHPEAYAAMLERYCEETGEDAKRINWSRAITSKIPSYYLLSDLNSFDFLAQWVYKNPEIHDNIHFWSPSFVAEQIKIAMKKFLEVCRVDLECLELQNIPWKSIEIYGIDVDRAFNVKLSIIRDPGYLLDNINDVHVRFKDSGKAKRKRRL